MPPRAAKRDASKTGSKADKGTKGERSREHLSEVALRLFRKNGFERTTMRQIAEEAGTALGAAYYYFPAKESILIGYYDARLRELEAFVAETDLTELTVGERFRAVMHRRFETIARDRNLYEALASVTADPKSPVGLFGKETAPLRARSREIFKLVLAPIDLDPVEEPLLLEALFLLEVALHLYFVYDTSKGITRTHALIDEVGSIIDDFIPLRAFAAPMFERIANLLKVAGIVLPATK